jgi:hypothetical protein
MVITVEKSLLNSQSILQDFALVEELDAQSAEIISGGRYCGRPTWPSRWPSGCNRPHPSSDDCNRPGPSSNDCNRPRPSSNDCNRDRGDSYSIC